MNSSFVTMPATRSKPSFGLSLLLAGLFVFSPFIASFARDISRKVESRAWTVLREALTSADSVTREKAVQALEFIPGEQAEKTLMSALRDESDYVRIWAARSLIRRGNPAGKEALLSILLTVPQGSADASGPLAALLRMRALAQGRLRGEAAKVLGLFNDPSLAPVLRNAKRDNDGRVRDGAAVGLALQGDTSEGIVFASAIKDKDKGVRLAAAEALEAMGDPRFAAAVQSLLDDPEPEIRNTAVRALGRMKAKDAAAGIAARLTDESGLVRESAAWALGEIGARERIPVLKASLSDPNAHVRVAAAEALGKLGDASGLPKIEGAIASNDLDARVKAAWALGAIDSPAAQALSVKTLDDGYLRVRLGAAVSLLKADHP